MAYDEEAFILIVVIAIFFACYKVCCIFFCSDESDEESAGFGYLRNLQLRQNDDVATGQTSNSHVNDNHNESALSPTQRNQSKPPVIVGSPQVPSAPQSASNLTEQFDSPPNYDEAMEQLLHEHNQQIV